MPRSPDAPLASSSPLEAYPERASAGALTPADCPGVDHPLEELISDSHNLSVSDDRVCDPLEVPEEIESPEDLRFDPSEFNECSEVVDDASSAIEIPDIWMLDPSYFTDSPEPRDDSQSDQNVIPGSKCVSLGVELDDLEFEEVPFGDSEYFEPSSRDKETESNPLDGTAVRTAAAEEKTVSHALPVFDALAELPREVTQGTRGSEISDTTTHDPDAGMALAEAYEQTNEIYVDPDTEITETEFENKADRVEFGAGRETEANSNPLWRSALNSFVDSERLSVLVRTSFAAVAIIILIIVAMVAALAYFNDYKVQSDLLFLSRDIDPRADIERSLDQESRILASKTLMYSFAEHIFKSADSAGEGSESDLGKADYVNTAKARFGEPGRLLKWLSGELSLTSDPAKGFVNVSVQGDDPEFLKAILDSYVQYYSVYRDSWLGRQQRSSPAAIVKPAIHPSGSIAKIENELQLTNARSKEFKLALDLMKSGRGPFRGFLPAGGATDLPSLAKFQSKIVELELKKRELAVRYKPGSREIHSIELEIAGVRRAMIDCVREHVRFLERRRHGLLAQMKEPNKSVTRIRNSVIIDEQKLAKPKPIPGSPLIGEGLYLTERAHVVRRPLLSSGAGDAKGTSSPSARQSSRISGIMNRLPPSHWFGAASQGQIGRPVDSDHGQARSESGAFSLAQWKMY